MPWRDAFALHIFAPAEAPYYIENWVEQILGTTVKPIIEKFSDHIRWIWVTRYSGPYSEESPPVNCLLPERYRNSGIYRFIVFRLSVSGDVRVQLHEEAIVLAQEAGCFTYPDGWINYDIVEDLGSIRFITENSDRESKNRRALLVVRFIDATIRLMLDSLISSSDGIWHREPNSLIQQNPNGSFFESIHHLFCNSTQIPTTILLSRNENQLMVRTFWMEPLKLHLNQIETNWKQVPIHY